MTEDTLRVVSRLQDNPMFLAACWDKAKEEMPELHKVKVYLDDILVAIITDDKNDRK